MKKFISILLILSIISLLPACGQKGGFNTYEGGGSVGRTDNSLNITEPETEAEILKPEKPFDKMAVINGLDIKEYYWENGSTYYMALVIKNNSGIDCSLKTDIIYNSSLSKESKTYNRDCLRNGDEICYVENSDIKFASYSREFTVEEIDPRAEFATDFIETRNNTEENKISVMVKNTGKQKVISDVYVVALFFHESNVVGWSSGYIDGEHGAIKPGSTANKEMEFYDKYSDVKTFVSASFSEQITNGLSQ